MDEKQKVSYLELFYFPISGFHIFFSSSYIFFYFSTIKSSTVTQELYKIEFDNRKKGICIWVNLILNLNFKDKKSYLKR
jgi:hypothetical protein